MDKWFCPACGKLAHASGEMAGPVRISCDCGYECRVSEIRKPKTCIHGHPCRTCLKDGQTHCIDCQATVDLNRLDIAGDRYRAECWKMERER